MADLDQQIMYRLIQRLIVAIWNAQRILARLYPVQDEDLARLSPLIFDHINMLGRYSFAVPEEVARGELRPLHNPDDDQ
ncbi:Tn3 family transposase [Pseudomonas syringae group genomosp. 3]|uniref:Tn3 family transposase n=1 Tax=Pseudomonas syringae group genomosp. 3 TaxID=251701 RepID=UPI000F004468|nr:Tn3 family transposase [Pseudomonas syringae group genomosp. 3]